MADSLGDRMKVYEKCSAVTLLPNTPIIIRVDGKAFHTFTKKIGLEKPFDEAYIVSMVEAATEVAKHMQNFKAAYIQSDEATFLLHGNNPLSESWFGGKVQKLTSISAAYMSAYLKIRMEHNIPCTIHGPDCIFDSRAFNVVERDIPNVFLWRMKDWRRNSVQMYARSIMSNKQMHGKSNREVLLELQELGYEWTDLDPRLRNGTLIFNHDRKIIEYTDFEPTYFEVNGIFQEYGIVS